MNKQAPEKVVRAGTTNLVVHSVFYTIQGEGPFAGQPAVFVRLAGCNLQCPLCDTEYTSTRTPMDPRSLLAYVSQVNRAASLIVVTGGEPFRQPAALSAFVRIADDSGYTVQVETNGTLPVPDDFPADAVIVVSPKTGTVHRSVASRSVHWKYVAKHGGISRFDGLPLHALEHPVSPMLARPPHGVTVYLQPVDEGNSLANNANQKAVVEACLAFGHTLCLQMHKIVGVE